MRGTPCRGLEERAWLLCVKNLRPKVLGWREQLEEQQGLRSERWGGAWVAGNVSGLWAALGLPFYSETGSLCGIPEGEWHGQIDILQESLWLRVATVCKWAGQRLGEHVGAVTAPGKRKTQIQG